MVRRYDLEDTEDGAGEMVERSHGDWVMADDYNELVSERDDLRKIIAEVIDRLRDA